MTTKKFEVTRVMAATPHEAYALLCRLESDVAIESSGILQSAHGDVVTAAVDLPAGPEADPLLAAVRARLADDLDTEGAIADIDVWVDRALEGPGASVGDEAVADDRAPALVRALVDARLGIAL